MKYTNVALTSQVMLELQASRGRSTWRTAEPEPNRRPRRLPSLRLLLSRA
ncbi:MAG TPA: hypothetical protein VGC78_12060 [Gaiellaceae bacterium]|jgi:hypothetical protein